MGGQVVEESSDVPHDSQLKILETQGIFAVEKILADRGEGDQISLPDLRDAY
jgi:hypothetical protein